MSAISTFIKRPATLFERNMGYTATAVLAMFAISYVATFAVDLFGWSRFTIQQSKSYPFSPDVQRWVGFFTDLLILPLIEEIVFRRFLLGQLQRWKINFWLAALITTIAWGAAHLPTTAHAAIVYLGIGMVLAYLYRKTGTLWACIAAHCAYNAVPALALLLYSR